MTKDIQIAKTIISQLGGSGKLKAMIGVKDFITVKNGLMFTFKGNAKMNKVVITLTPLDLYDIKFYKINTKNIEKSMIPVYELEDVYFDMLIPLFEHTTGLYLHF